MPLYFAYGANMDVAAMAGRCPGSKPLGLARLPRHRFIITRDGYASVIRDPRASVHGVLWDLALSDVRVLDRFEEVDRGLYAKITQPVIAEGGPRRALVYVGASAEIGAPRPGYLESVLDSALSWGLPEAYTAEMKRFLRGGPTLREPPPAGPVPGVQTRADAPRTTVGAARASHAWSWKP
ncbi:MAG: gamma-glutamylcyclotransferase [Hyphomicrobiales bacterium]|nr:gamma-glutamylcyclotransferase [Hyphomicrobiales bacterium]